MGNNAIFTYFLYTCNGICSIKEVYKCQCCKAQIKLLKQYQIKNSAGGSLPKYLGTVVSCEDYSQEEIYTRFFDRLSIETGISV